MTVSPAPREAPATRRSEARAKRSGAHAEPYHGTPPSTRRMAPVVKLDASRREVERGADDLVGLAAAAEGDAASSRASRSASMSHALAMSVRNGPGMDAVHPHLRAERRGEARRSWRSAPALAAAYGSSVGVGRIGARC